MKKRGASFYILIVLALLAVAGLIFLLAPGNGAETPAVVLLTLLSRNRKDGSLCRKALMTVGIGLAGVAIVGAASGLSLLLNSVTDEWFACIAFLLLWGFILARMLAQIIGGRNRLTFKGKKDWTLLLFWAAMYGYCLAALWSLEIPQTVPWYGALGVILAAGTLLLSMG